MTTKLLFHTLMGILMFFSASSQADFPDCITPYKVKPGKNGPFYNVEGAGEIKEISGHQLGNLHWFMEEHYTTWIEIDAKKDTRLSFEIIPNDQNQDFDFLVFEKEDDNSCEQIKSEKLLPIRTNIARNNGDGRTGLRTTASQKYVSSGPGNNYSSSIDITEDATFIVVVDAPNSPNSKGFHFVFSDTSPKRKETKNFVVKVVDHETGSPVNSILSIVDEITNEEENHKDVSEIDVLSGNKYYYKCNAKDYMLEAGVFLAMTSNGASLYEIRLKKIEPGVKFDLKNVNFYGNMAVFLPNARPALLHLLEFMQLNPDVKIMIEGHVNGPDKPNDHSLQKLSEDRAMAVIAFLKTNGITGNRMKNKGYGNTQMLFPQPFSEAEHSANRRVEIKVIE